MKTTADAKALLVSSAEERPKEYPMSPAQRLRLSTSVIGGLRLYLVTFTSIPLPMNDTTQPLLLIPGVELMRDKVRIANGPFVP